jgi:hypothetical protein
MCNKKNAKISLSRYFGPKMSHSYDDVEKIFDNLIFFSLDRQALLVLLSVTTAIKTSTGIQFFGAGAARSRFMSLARSVPVLCINF